MIDHTDIPMAVLAGGLATRLGGLAAKTPKCLMDVHGWPCLTRQLQTFADQGLRRAVLCVSHLGSTVRDHYGREAFGIHLDYSFDQLNGTGGALRMALPWLGSRFYVLNGDTLLGTRLDALAAAAGRGSAMAVSPSLDGNVVIEGERVVSYGRGGDWKDAGLALLSLNSLDGYGETFALGRVFEDLALGGRLRCFKTEAFYDIGTPETLEQTRKNYKAK